MRLLLLIGAALVTTQANAGNAFWTGRSTQVQTVTYQMAWNCEYNYNGQIFWRVFKTTCPSSITVY